MAPEVLEMGSGNSSSDVYSMGIVMWEIATGDIPWSTWNRDDYLTFSQVQPLLRSQPVPRAYPEMWSSVSDMLYFCASFGDV